MASGDKTAQQGEHSAMGFSTALQGNAAGLNNALAPELSTMASHPMGFAPSDVAAMETEAKQNAGGSNAGAVGQGALLAGRTKNAGTADAAIQEAARRSGQTLADTGLGIQTANARLKEAQREAGLKGMEGLYSTDVGGANEALAELAKNSEANTAADNWASQFGQVLGGLGSLGGGAGAVGLKAPF